MPKINLQQDTDEWHVWRSGGIGGSSAAILMGTDRYGKTVESLYLEKLGFGEKIKSNYAMNRGKTLEPIARVQFSEKVGIEFKPECFQHDEHSFLRVSTDGWSDAHLQAIEIKCANKTYHELAEYGVIHDHYYPQCQYITLVTETESLYYVSFNGKTLHDIVCPRDYKYTEELLRRCIKFWQCIQTTTPPVSDDYPEYVWR